MAAIEFLANGEGVFHYQELMQNAAGEGVDLSGSEDLDTFQEAVIEMIDKICGESN